jgi:hypothetical protein
LTIINELLLSANYELKNIEGDLFSPYVLMDQYNKGNKLLRKTILDHFPMQLAEEVTGTVNAGESITIVKKPIKIIDFRVNKKRVFKIYLSGIPDKTITGQPTHYYLLNTSTVKLYPTPDKSYSYDMTYIPESVNMEDTDDSGYQTDVEQLLIRYMVATLSGQGFDLAVEYNRTIGSMLSALETGVTVVDGYYEGGCRGGDYN